MFQLLVLIGECLLINVSYGFFFKSFCDIVFSNDEQKKNRKVKKKEKYQKGWNQQLF